MHCMSLKFEITVPFLFRPCSSRLQPEGYKRLLSSASPIPLTVDTEPRHSASVQQSGNGTLEPASVFGNGTPEPSSPTPARNEDDASEL